jgi:hypothetical protein
MVGRIVRITDLGIRIDSGKCTVLLVSGTHDSICKNYKRMLNLSSILILNYQRKKNMGTVSYE